MVFVLVLCGFVLHSSNINLFLDVKLVLHPWRKFYFFRVHAFCVSGFVVLIFCWGFSMYIHKWFSYLFFAWFWYKGNIGLIRCVQKSPLSFYFLNIS